MAMPIGTCETKALTRGKIYFLQAGTRVKIGFTTGSVVKRRKSLQTGCADPLILRGVIPGSQSLEKALHRAFAEHRKGGEWFDLCPEIEEFIQDSTFTPDQAICRIIAERPTREQAELMDEKRRDDIEDEAGGLSPFYVIPYLVRWVGGTVELIFARNEDELSNIIERYDSPCGMSFIPYSGVVRLTWSSAKECEVQAYSEGCINGHESEADRDRCRTCSLESPWAHAYPRSEGYKASVISPNSARLAMFVEQDLEDAVILADSEGWPKDRADWQNAAKSKWGPRSGYYDSREAPGGMTWTPGAYIGCMDCETMGYHLRELPDDPPPQGNAR